MKKITGPWLSFGRAVYALQARQTPVRPVIAISNALKTKSTACACLHSHCVTGTMWKERGESLSAQTGLSVPMDQYLK